MKAGTERRQSKWLSDHSKAMGSPAADRPAEKIGEYSFLREKTVTACPQNSPCSTRLAMSVTFSLPRIGKPQSFLTRLAHSISLYNCRLLETCRKFLCFFSKARTAVFMAITRQWGANSLGILITLLADLKSLSIVLLVKIGDERYSKIIMINFMTLAAVLMFLGFGCQVH